MRKVILILALLLISLSAFSADKRLLGVKRRWKPATFRGLVLGKATFRDLVLAFPHPSEVGYWSAWSADHGMNYDSDITPTRYEVVIEGATYQFEIRKGLIQRVWPPIDSLRETEKQFGKNFIEVDYGFCDSATKGGSGTYELARENRAGDFLERYYPEKGIVVSYYYNSGTAVRYDAQPFHTPVSSKCPDPWYLRSAASRR